MALNVQQFLKLNIMIIFLTISFALPVPKNDIIAGQDFLSLFIDQEETFKDTKRGLNTGRTRTIPIHINDEDGILPIEAMFSSHDELNKESSNHHYEYQRKKHNLDASTVQIPSVISELGDKTTEANTEVIKTLQDVKSADSIISGSEISVLDSQTKEEVNAQKFSLNPKKEDEIKIISVSVSSSIHQSQSNRAKETELKSTTVKNEILEDIDNKFISNSHKNDFSIEEIDPLTQDKDDSIKSESTNIHSIVPPPSMQQSQLRTRTQRKQDTIIPYQTIIYHDANQKEDNIHQKSVSYTSVEQTIGEIKTWRQYDINTQKKINITDIHLPKIYGEVSHVYSEPSKVYSEPQKIYSQPSKVYSEPSKFYSEPSKVYSEPSKIYSEPSKIYGLPEKVYSEPSKVYSVPSKIYSEPSKVYSEPSKMYGVPSKVYFEVPTITTPMPSTQTRRIIFNLDRLPYDLLNAPTEENENKPMQHGVHFRYKPSDKNSIDQKHLFEKHNGLVTSTSSSASLLQSPLTDYLTSTLSPQQGSQTSEHNYENNKDFSITTNERNHGFQSSLPTPDPNDDSQKVGYVVEGRNYRKYRVEEKTADGFIVGEYGVVSHNDGSLRGVRYTADSDINPKLIYDALLKFLSL